MCVDLWCFEEGRHLFRTKLIVWLTFIINRWVDAILVVVLSSSNWRIEHAHDVHVTGATREDVLLATQAIKVAFLQFVKSSATGFILIHDLNGALALHNEHTLDVILIPLKAALALIHGGVVHAEAAVVSSSQIASRFPKAFATFLVIPCLLHIGEAAEDEILGGTLNLM